MDCTLCKRYERCSAICRRVANLLPRLPNEELLSFTPNELFKQAEEDPTLDGEWGASLSEEQARALLSQAGSLSKQQRIALSLLLLGASIPLIAEALQITERAAYKTLLRASERVHLKPRDCNGL